MICGGGDGGIGQPRLFADIVGMFGRGGGGGEAADLAAAHAVCITMPSVLIEPSGGAAGMSE